MRLMMLLAVATTALGLGFATAPASATPAAPSGLSQTVGDVVQIRMTRMERRRMMQRRSMMHRRMGRRSAPSQAGNARDPSRAVPSQGQTTGGPRY